MQCGDEVKSMREKLIEEYFCKRGQKVGDWLLKVNSTSMKDCLTEWCYCLMECCFFAEMKATGKTARALQEFRT